MAQLCGLSGFSKLTTTLGRFPSWLQAVWTALGLCSRDGAWCVEKTTETTESPALKDRTHVAPNHTGSAAPPTYRPNKSHLLDNFLPEVQRKMSPIYGNTGILGAYSYWFMAEI